MNEKIKIYVAGHNGMVGSSIIKRLKQNNAILITANREKLDLTNQSKVRNFFNENKPNQVYLAAAKVGGIFSNNQYPADFIYENLMIQANIINAAFSSGVKKLLFLGSSCIYPKLSKQPMVENDLLSGYLEPTNEPYAIAKIAGIKLCESYNRQYNKSHGIDYRSIMPTNLYGPGDNYHPDNSHVIPGLIQRFHKAKINNQSSVSVWGTGEVYREFLYVDDMADACVYLMNLDFNKFRSVTEDMLSHVNVGYGEDITIRDLAHIIADVIGYKGNIIFDTSKPDGTPKKLLDSSKIKSLGWNLSTPLEEGLKLTYQDYKKNNQILRS